MRILFGGLAALTLSAASVMAADIPARMPVKAPVMAPEVYNWTGFYIGGNGGYSWGRSRSDVSFFGAGGVPIVPPAGSVTAPSAIGQSRSPDTFSTCSPFRCSRWLPAGKLQRP